MKDLCLGKLNAWFCLFGASTEDAFESEGKASEQITKSIRKRWFQDNKTYQAS